MVKKKSCSGFTLVEVLVVVGLFSLILGSILGVFLTGNMAWNVGQANIGLQQQTRYGLYAMVRELSLSQQNNVRIINPNTLRLQVPLNAANPGGDGRSRIDIRSGRLIWGADANQGDWIEYRVENNELKRKVFNQSAGGLQQAETTLARDIQTVIFRADQISTDPSWPQGVEITLTTARGNSSCSLNTMVFFKNN